MDLSNFYIKGIIVLSPPPHCNVKYKFLNISYNIFIKNRLSVIGCPIYSVAELI